MYLTYLLILKNIIITLNLFFIFSFEFQGNVLSSGIIYGSENAYSIADKEIRMTLTHQYLTVTIHLEMRSLRMKSIQPFQLIQLKCYSLLMDVQNLVEELNITGSFF